MDSTSNLHKNKMGSEAGEVPELEDKPHRSRDTLPQGEREIAETPQATQGQDLLNRIHLMRILNGLVPQQLNELLWYINPPAGIIPAAPAVQADRVYDFLTWAESPSGCGLNQIKQALKQLQPTIWKQKLDETSELADEEDLPEKPKEKSKGQEQIQSPIQTNTLSGVTVGRDLHYEPKVVHQPCTGSSS